MINNQEVEYYAKRVKHFMELDELIQQQEHFVYIQDFKNAHNMQILIENKIATFMNTGHSHPM